MAEADSGRRSRITLIAVDQSEWSEQAFECEYVIPFSCEKKICSCARHTVGTATELNIRHTEILISSTYLPKFFTNF